MTSTLTDRYVHASTRYLAAGRRGDIAKELASSIDDMVSARVSAGEDPAAAERAVLTDLGDPDMMAAQYSSQPMHLIGPRFFPTYLRVTVMILLIAPPIVGIISAIADVADESSAGAAIAGGLGTAFMVAIQVVFWSTLSFALIERFGSEDDLPAWDVDKLPEISHSRQVSLADTVSSVVFIGFVAGMLVFQHFRSWVDDPFGNDVPVLNPGLWSFWLPFLLVVLLASMVVEVWKYRVGSITWPIVGGVAVTSILWLAPVIWLASRDELLSRPFVTALDINATNLDRINGAIVVIAAIIEVMTVADVVVKARRRTD